MKTERQHRLSIVSIRLGLALILLGLGVAIALARMGRADIIGDQDWGDAPDYGPAAGGYPTLLVSSGASHVLGSDVYLGQCVDAEADGQHNIGANGDDLAAGSPAFGPCPRADDEDGVTFLSPLYLGDTAHIEVVASAPCTLSAWVDFDHNLSWGDAGEDLFPGGQGLSAGANSLTFAVTSTASYGDTYARFRCTTDGAVSYTGVASDGEVEDYKVTILSRWDWGDAPDPGYPTLMSSDGAYHLLGSGVYLGSCVDADLDGQPTSGADGDDLNPLSPVEGTCTGGDDEDGVVFVTDLTVGDTTAISVTASAPCTLTGWIDYNRDGDWNDNLEELFPGGESLVAGTRSLSFTVPSQAFETTTFARFRCTSAGPVGVWGMAPDGEVEDYRVRVGNPLDLGDAPDPTYPTLLGSGGASHGLGSGLYLGNCVDGEWDGQPDAGATGDDANPGAPVYGTCIGGDDEDGVTFTSDLISGTTAYIDVKASGSCLLGGWIDFNQDGDWNDDLEDIFNGKPLVAGTNSLSFTVPRSAVTGPTYARFRCSTEPDLTYTGHLPDGEVEDYLIRIGPSLDLGDAPDPTYPTLLGSGGASHAIGGAIYMGSCVDGEVNGQPSPFADGDDLIAGYRVVGTCTGGDDEDGVAFDGPLNVGTTAGISVTVSEVCTLSAWVDFDRDGDWADAGENLFPGGEGLVIGVNALTFAVPAGATPGPSYARFRCTGDGAVSYTGHASDGEVEDYRVAIVDDWDLGDAPDPTYPTLKSSTGALHALGSNVYLGDCVDAEPNGQPTAAADGDDANGGSPTFGDCTRIDDEDGVTFATPLYPGSTTDIAVVAHEDCTLSAWVDFNDDGDWNDAGEDVFPGGQPLAAGINSLSFAVPAWATPGDTFARFRCTTDGPVPFFGIASDGEVEDYAVTVLKHWDFGDAQDPMFPTLLASDGPYHVLGSGIYLGGCVDAEPDGQPTPGADGDDASAGSPAYGVCEGGDDEDGVRFASNLLADSEATIEVVASLSCTLSGWIDFGQDGDWDHAGESLFPGGRGLVPGTNPLTFTVPADAVEGSTQARFRCTTGGAVPYTGMAPDGEVEDYEVTIGPIVDYGDAPDPTFPTLLASGGASHDLGSNVYLGFCVDAEPDGQPTSEADGDDVNGSYQVLGNCSGEDDEDGVSFATPLTVGGTITISVLANDACTLSAWADFNRDGDWADAGEDLFPGGQALSAGPNPLTSTIPADALWGNIYTRFRCTTGGVISYTGTAPDGEVEDYRIEINPAGPLTYVYLPLVLRD